jgi:predicted MFS family arabinose efflux permease
MPTSNAAMRTTITGFLSLAVAMGIGRFAFTPLLPLMQDDGLMTVAEGGVMASIHFLGYLLGALTAARASKYPRATLQLSLFAIGAATLGMGLVAHFALWLILRFICGVCSAYTLVVISNYTVKHLAAAGQPQMQGWVFSGVGAGIALAGLGTLALMAAETASAQGWQIFGAISLAAAVAISLAAGHEIPTAPRGAHARIAVRTPLAWRSLVAYGTTGIGYVIPAIYLPVMARDAVSSPLIFGWSWPLFGAAAFLSTLISARLHALFSNRQVWAASQFIMALGLLLPALLPHIITVTVAGLCVGGTFMIITMAGMKEAHRIASDHDVQWHIAALTTAFAVGQMIGPAIAGWIFNLTGTFSSVLVVTSIMLAITAIILVRRAPTREFART